MNLTSLKDKRTTEQKCNSATEKTAVFLLCRAATLSIRYRKITFLLTSANLKFTLNE